MAEIVEVGTILIADIPLILHALDLESDSYSGTWRVLQSTTSDSLDRKIRGSGWNFFFMAGEVKATVFGRLAAKSVRRALKQILTNVRKPELNCLQVTGIVQKSFLGFPYLTVRAHSRHIQQGCLLNLTATSAAA